MCHQVKDVEVEKIGVKLEVLAKLAMGHCSPFFLGHQLSVVILYSTAPVVCNFADDVLVFHLPGLKAFCRYILEVKEVIVIIHINTDKTFWHNIERVDVLKVVVDINPTILPQNHCHMVEIVHQGSIFKTPLIVDFDTYGGVFDPF